MKTLTSKTNLTRVALLGALTVAPALALTSASVAQADSARRAPVATRGYSAPAWNNSNNQRYQTPRGQAPRFDSRYTPAPRVQAPHYDGYRNDSYRNNERFDTRRDSRRNQNNGNDTGKIIGAGIVGAILGAVLSH
jgi:hypothetical protein